MYQKVSILFMIFTKTLSWTISSSKPLCDNLTSIDISDGNHIGDTIYHKGIKYQKGHDYYYDNETNTERGCICLKDSCLRKCCPYGYGYDPISRECVVVNDVFDPPIYDKYMQVKENLHASKFFHMLIDKINCSKMNNSSVLRVRVSKITEMFRLLIDGSLYIELPEDIPPWTSRTSDEYCLDTFVIEDENGVKTTKLDALVCFATDEEDTHNYLLSSVCMLISCFFILLTLGVYGWLPELQNLYGKVLMAYLTCLLVGFLLLACMQILLYVNKITPDYCVLLTFMIYFSLLSAFFWLNVMCFDIYWTFSGKRGLSLEKLSTRGRFMAYATYAFGIPTLLTLLMIGLEFSGMPLHPLMPGIRHHGCFIHGTRKLLYLYCPILILCIANIAFFGMTALRIACISRQTSVLQSKESATHDQQRKDKQRLLLYIKLFSVMGISWILEVVAAIFPEAHMFWQYTDTYNVLIGFIIFVIFVCKRKILRLMKKRLNQIRGIPMSRSQTTSSRICSTREETRTNSIKMK